MALLTTLLHARLVMILVPQTMHRFGPSQRSGLSTFSAYCRFCFLFVFVWQTWQAALMLGVKVHFRGLTPDVVPVMIMVLASTLAPFPDIAIAHEGKPPAPKIPPHSSSEEPSSLSSSSPALFLFFLLFTSDTSPLRRNT